MCRSIANKMRCHANLCVDLHSPSEFNTNRGMFRTGGKAGAEHAGHYLNCLRSATERLNWLQLSQAARNTNRCLRIRRISSVGVERPAIAVDGETIASRLAPCQEEQCWRSARQVVGSVRVFNDVRKRIGFGNSAAPRRLRILSLSRTS